MYLIFESFIRMHRYIYELFLSCLNSEQWIYNVYAIKGWTIRDAGGVFILIGTEGGLFSAYAFHAIF